MKHPNLKSIAVLLASLYGAAHAAGFALIEQNASGLGNAYAGQAAVAEDASTIFFNPAGMTKLPDRQLVGALHAIKPSAKYSDVNGTPDGGDAGGWALVPNFYYAMALSPDVRIGIGINSPFGLKTDYDDGWAGDDEAIKSDLKTINLNPSIAWKLSDELSLGAGINVQWIEATLTNRIPIFGQPLVTIKGDDFGLGYDLGVLWQPAPGTRVGLTYRSEIDYKLGGKSSTANPVVAPLNGPVTAKVTMPDSASLSLFHRLSPQWELLADITWTGWSDFDDLPIVGTVNKTTLEDWNNNLRYSVGVTWHMSEKLSLRGGLAYDETPVPDPRRTPRIPDESRTWIAAGFSYQLSPKGTLHAGYAHLFVNDSYQPAVNALPVGEYENQVDILSFQYTHTF
jgi:long-chain fatty acid transport protein